MSVTTFDTLKYANALKAAGVPEKQAEAQATVLSEALAVNLKDLATKEDLKQLETSLRSEITNLRDLFKWMIGVVIGINMAVFAFLLRLVFAH